MSVDPHPPFSQFQRIGFLWSNGNGVTYPDADIVEVFNDPFSFRQIGGFSSMMQTIKSIGATNATGLFFRSLLPAISSEDGIGANIPGVGAFESDQSATGEVKVMANFNFDVQQDANGNKYQLGKGVRFKNTLLSQTFTATYDANDPFAGWEWLTSGANLEEVNLLKTATEVNWQDHPNYFTTIDLDEYEFVAWTSEFNYEFKQGWFNPPNLYWYPTTATVSIKQLIGFEESDPGYQTPDEYPIGSTNANRAFNPTEIDPPCKAYT